MEIAEACQECGADRPSWLGGTHHKRNFSSGSKGEVTRVCRDGVSPLVHWLIWSQRPRNEWPADAFEQAGYMRPSWPVS